MKLMKEYRQKEEEKRRINKLEKKFGKERTDIMNKIKIKELQVWRENDFFPFQKKEAIKNKEKKKERKKEKKKEREERTRKERKKRIVTKID